MTVEGVVKNGVVVLDQPAPVPDGTRVQVILPDAVRPTLADSLLKFAGAVGDLPPDMAERHDHYLHGTPKQ
jgi:hypothetical protein